MTIKKVLVLIFALLFLVSGCGSDTTTNSSSILPTKNIQSVCQSHLRHELQHL